MPPPRELRPLVISASAPALGATATALLGAPPASRGLQLADDGLTEMLGARGFTGSSQKLHAMSAKLEESFARAQQQYALAAVPAAAPVRLARASQVIPKSGRAAADL